MTADTARVLYMRAEIEGSALGDEIVFFDDRVGKYFATGRVGADIWKLLETPKSLDDIVRCLLNEYDVSEPTCRAETKAFVEQMVAINLVKQV